MSIRNWAGNVRFKPAQLAFPDSEEAIRELVLKSAERGQNIRMIGSGHSFTALCQTDDCLISLDKYQGLVSVDKQRMEVCVKAGTKLRRLGALLFEQGLAMENLGDIDAQSIAGTISTGTHGTGTDFGTISTQVVGLRLVNGKGEVINCSPSENPELFKAAQVSLGALGIITEVKLRCVPAYKLCIDNRKEAMTEVMATIDGRNAENRNFEFYWFPYTETAWTKTTNIAVAGEPDKDSYLNYLSELLLENYSFQALCELARRFPSQNKRVSRIGAQFVPTMRKLSLSHRVYATKRLVRFTEMEYNVPAEAYPIVMQEVMGRVNAGRFPVHFPIESRWVKGDDICMSPAYGRDSAYIACHMYAKKDSRAYFRELEAIFKAYGGRPHWGKLHSWTRADVEASYPGFADFAAIRRQQDPQQLFINQHLQDLLL